MVPTGKAAQAVSKIASGLPDVVQSIACEGTAIESSSWGVKKKNFLFLGLKGGCYTLRLKLAASVPEAKKLMKQDPERFNIGVGGWAKVTFGEAEKAPVELLRRWIAESHRLITG
jgi:hypothetical protein